MKTAKQLTKSIRSTQRAYRRLNEHCIEAKITVRHGVPAIEITGNTFPVRDAIKEMGGQWLQGWRTWVVVPGRFDANKLASAL